MGTVPGDTMDAESLNAETEPTHYEAYYLFFISGVGLVLNTLIITSVIFREHLRRMTCAFLVHGCLLNMAKSIFCVLFGKYLLTQEAPKYCSIIGESFIIIVTASTFNLVAIVCSEAYTFQELNVGGNHQGSVCCVIFGVLVVYFGSVILHLGPTIIGGYLDFHKDIGYCSFQLGEVKSYVANVIWIVIVTLALISVTYYLSELYKEIQLNSPNRVSMLVRTSVCLSENPLAAQRSVKTLVQDSRHRVKVLIGVTVSFILCWYPYFALLVIDMNANVSATIYQLLCFLAWSHGTVEAFIYICFDRQLHLVTQLTYWRKRRFPYLDGIAPLIHGQRANDVQRNRQTDLGSFQGSLGTAAIEEEETVIPNVSSTCNAVDGNPVDRSVLPHSDTPTCNESFLHSQV